jgi:hypothetical protein
MNSTANKQSGFSIVEAVLAILVIGAMAAAGVFVYQHNQAKVTDAAPHPNSSSSQQTTTTTPTPTQNVIKIPELGIQITVPDSIKDLTYKVTTAKLRNGNQATIAYFSTASL